MVFKPAGKATENAVGNYFHQMLGNVLENHEVVPGYFKLVLDSIELAKKARPGQFLMMKVSESYDPLLRRPMGIYKISNFDGRPCVELLYQVVGKGTISMSKMEKGGKVDILGPFGNGFTIPHQIKEAVFVAGGVGVAPLVILAEKLLKEIPNLKTYLFIGGKSKNDILCLDDFEKLNTEISIATEDGSLGTQGLVLGTLKQFMVKKDCRNVSFFACGPGGMLKKLSKLTLENNIYCQVSLDRRMACGFGVCLGCVIKVKTERSEVYKNVCTDGPVFDAGEVVW